MVSLARASGQCQDIKTATRSNILTTCSTTFSSLTEKEMRSRRKGKEAPTELTMPITPMLDMSFQLLFFFITTFKLPTGMEGEMDLALPREGQVGNPVQQGPVAAADLPLEITIAIKSEAAD